MALNMNASKSGIQFCCAYMCIPSLYECISQDPSLIFSYFTDLAEELPDDTLILTLGCAKNRFIRSEKLMNATLSNGMPRILDMGKSHYNANARYQ